MPVVTYSLLRLAVFALALLGLWLAGMGSWLLVVVAAVVAAALSYVLLGKQRSAAVAWMADRRSSPRFSRAVQDDADAEDAIADRLRADTPDDVADDTAGDTDDDVAGDTAGGTDQSASPSPSSTP